MSTSTRLKKTFHLKRFSRTVNPILTELKVNKFTGQKKKQVSLINPFTALPRRLLYKRMT